MNVPLHSPDCSARPSRVAGCRRPLTLDRACYHGDRALGLAETSLSPGATRMVGLAAADFSFAATSDLLWERSGVRIENKHGERCGEALGCQIAADERDRVAPAPAAAPTMYVGWTATGVRVRKIRGGRPARQAARPFGQDPRCQAGHRVLAEGATSRQARPRPWAAVESAASRDTDPLLSAFARRLYRVAQRRGFDTTARRALLGDGGNWIRNLVCSPGN